jgi:ribosomal protein L37E
MGMCSYCGSKNIDVRFIDGYDCADCGYDSDDDIVRFDAAVKAHDEAWKAANS